MTTQLPSINETIYRLANHIAGAKGGLPAEWQDWADEIETDLRALLSAYEQEHISGTTIQPVSDLYAITVPGCEGEYFTTDVAEVSRCVKRGFSVREYVKLERLQAAYAHPAPSVPAVPDEKLKSQLKTI